MARRRGKIAHHSMKTSMLTLTRQQISRGDERITLQPWAMSHPRLLKRPDVIREC